MESEIYERNLFIKFFLWCHKRVMLFFRFISFNWSCRLQFPIDFFSSILADFLITLIQLGFISTVFLHLKNIVGWNFHQALIIFGFARITFGIYNAIFSLWSFSSIYILNGKLDYVLVRPVSPLFQVSVKAPTDIGNLLTGGVALIYGGMNVQWHLNFFTIITTLCLITIGIIVYLSLFLAVESLHFWLPSRISNSIFVYHCVLFAQYPLSLYDDWVKVILKHIIPVLIGGYFPAAILLGRETCINALFYAFVGLIPIFTISTILWRMGLRRYNSAGN